MRETMGTSAARTRSKLSGAMKKTITCNLQSQGIYGVNYICCSTCPERRRLRVRRRFPSKTG